MRRLLCRAAWAALGSSGRSPGSHLAVVAPGDRDTVGGRRQVHEVGEVDGPAGPLGFHPGFVGGVVALGQED